MNAKTPIIRRADAVWSIEVLVQEFVEALRWLHERHISQRGVDDARFASTWRRVGESFRGDVLSIYVTEELR